MICLQILQSKIKEEVERKQSASDYNLQKYKVYWFDPRTQQMSNVRIFLSSDATLEIALENAHKRFKFCNIAPIERCRLVAYDSSDENVQCSFDGKESEPIRDILSDLPLAMNSEFLLEIRDEDSNFEVYVPGDIETKVYTVDLNTSDIDGPTAVRVNKNVLIKQYKQILATKLDMSVDDIAIAILKYTAYAALLDNDNAILADEDVRKSFSTKKNPKAYLKFIFFAL